MRIKILGSGDAFGSGGRFNACFLVDRGRGSFLIDCGASSMIAIRKFGVDPDAIGAIVISHLHGDHFGGLPFFILDAQFVSGRTRALTIAGPPGLSARLAALTETMFPGSSRATRKFPLELIELQPERRAAVGGDALFVSSYAVLHPSGAPALALRVECDGRVIAYTGDTEWVDAIVDAGRDADLLIAECSWRAWKARYHLDLATVKAKLPGVGAKRVLLTHMSSDMLAGLPDAGGFDTAFDGLEIEIG